MFTTNLCAQEFLQCIKLAWKTIMAIRMRTSTNVKFSKMCLADDALLCLARLDVKVTETVGRRDQHLKDDRDSHIITQATASGSSTDERSQPRNGQDKMVSLQLSIPTASPNTRFVDGVTQSMMESPVLLQTSQVTVDETTLVYLLLQKSPRCPFTRATFDQHSFCRLPELQQEIHNWKTDASTTSSTSQHHNP
ncbi:hypothetical protein Pcinc_005147 [Petrolisthes cinctipes]|uniref:U-box domain-containing protein n=1 Tax=Petrolisthes cinctipes TaxID=88211 RepID=A0AAE1L333_PETCI|nr:hypothetical protein Pcinc_005147 [Petrolisthes cinctipes]